jgi:phage terminase large subunit
MEPLNIKISKKIFNEAYLPYLEDYSHRFNVFYGGA